MELSSTLVGFQKIGLIGFGNALQLGSALSFDDSQEAVSPAQRGVAMHAQRMGCLAQRLRLHQRLTEIEPTLLFAQTCQRCPGQGVEGTLAGKAAITLQATDLAIAMHRDAMAAWAATCLCRTWRFNERRDLLLPILLIEAFPELLALA